MGVLLLIDRALPQMPSTGVWQSFTPAWSGNLTEIDVFFGFYGPADACVPYSGSLSVYSGAGDTHTPHFTASQLILTQPVTTTCQCDAEGCLAWNTFVLRAPVAVTAETTFSWALSGPSHTAAMYRVGVFVADVYQRGVNNFPAYGYDFTFATYMSSAEGQGVQFYTQDPTASVPTTESASAGSSAAQIPIIVGAVAGCCVLAIFVVFVVMKKRRQSRAASSDNAEWLSVGQATAELKDRFTGAFGEVKPMFNEEPKPNMYRRNLAAMDSILSTDGNDQLQYDNHPSQLSLSNEADIMAEKKFVWDSKTKSLVLVRTGTAEPRANTAK